MWLLTNSTAFGNRLFMGWVNFMILRLLSQPHCFISKYESMHHSWNIYYFPKTFYPSKNNDFCLSWVEPNFLSGKKTKQFRSSRWKTHQKDVKMFCQEHWNIYIYIYFAVRWSIRETCSYVNNKNHLEDNRKLTQNTCTCPVEIIIFV